MARINSPLLGNAARGRVGNMVLKKIPGVEAVIASGYQPTVANPATQGQIQQRTQQGSAAILASALYQGYIPQFYKVPTGLRSYIAAVVQSIRKYQLDIVPAADGLGIAGYGFVTSAAALANAAWPITLGNMTADVFDLVTASVDVANTSGDYVLSYNLDWSSTVRPNTVENADDVLYIALIDVVTGSSAVVERSATRSTGSDSGTFTNPIGTFAAVGSNPVVFAPFFARLDTVTGTLNVTTQYRFAVATGAGQAEILGYPTFDPTGTGTGRVFIQPSTGSTIRG